MNILYLIIVAILVYHIWYRIRYSKDLDTNEIIQLAKCRRLNTINQYYSYPKTEYSVDVKFKKNMKASGKFYKMNEKLYTLPATVAGLLKYKKHEWVVVAFEKNKKIDLMWVNKGNDNKSVGLFLDFNDAIDMAEKEGYTGILFFHNHPNTNPNIYDCTQPSNMDLVTANEYWNMCNRKDINLIEYICERGISYRYFFKTVDEFYNINKIKKDIESVNGKSSKDNLRLHKERISLENIRLESN